MLYTIALDVYIALVVTEMPKNSSLLHSSISDVFKTRCRITIPFPHRHHLFPRVVVSRDPRDIKRLPSTGTDRYPPHKRNLRGRIFRISRRRVSAFWNFTRTGVQPVERLRRSTNSWRNISTSHLDRNRKLPRLRWIARKSNSYARDGRLMGTRRCFSERRLSSPGTRERRERD